MEFLSLPHTRDALRRLIPEVNDTLLTNLRNPLMTLIEDTTPGAHDTLTAACDASLYATLGVDKPEEHGSCAENLVLALKEINEKVGLQGPKAIGADVTVYIAPTPLHLFMNAPLQTSKDSSTSSEASGARGTSFKVEEPKGKKRGYVRFRAERDMVVVMSACPMDVGPQNGTRPMAANFMVEEVSEEDMSASINSLKDTANNKPPVNSTRPKPRKLESGTSQKSKSVSRTSPAETKTPEPKKRRDSGAGEGVTKPGKKTDDTRQEETLKPKKKPKKLERRSTPSVGTAIA
jgi:uncharacterized protein YcgI (DUF1989 family)